MSPARHPRGRSAAARLWLALLLSAALGASLPAKAAGPERSVPEAKPLGLRVEVSPQPIALGDPFALTIAVEHPRLDVYALAEQLVLDPLSLRGAPTVARKNLGERAETVFTLPLVNVGSLESKVPLLTLLVDGPEGRRALTVPGRKIPFRSLVAEERQPSPEAAHHGPKPPVPIKVRSWLWLWILGGLALALASFFLARALLRRRSLAGAAPSPRPPPDEEALARISALRSRAPWTRGLARAAIFELSEIVRGYLGERLSFDALDCTTDELLAELRRRRLLGLDLSELSDEVRFHDLVKFAKAEPSAEECILAIERAAEMIRRTAPTPRPQPTKGAAA